MAYIDLQNGKTHDFTIMLFAEGTILKPKSFFSLYNHRSYIPIGNAVAKIAEWEKQGAQIVYCTSRKKRQAQENAKLLLALGFHGTRLYYREGRQKYKDIIETVRPHVLIEDDCKSIGGSWQMCISYVSADIKRTIRSVVVKEFQGIDALPDNISEWAHAGN